MANILITGSSGFIGRVLTKTLFENHKVYGIDIVHPKYNGGYMNSYLVLDYASIVNKETIRNFILRHNIDTVVHLAAISNITDCETFPKECSRVNVAGTQLLIDTMKDAGVNNIIFASSAAVYGNYHKAITENILLNPINIYGMSKMDGEVLIANSKLNYMNLRFFNVCGTDKNCTLGEDMFPSHIISKAVKHSIYNSTFTLNGNTYNTSDGTCVRDYIDVQDVCNVMKTIIENSLYKNEAINVGSGKGISNLQILKAIEKETKNGLSWVVGSKRTGDPDFLVANTEKYDIMVPYILQHTNLIDIIKNTETWYRKVSV